MHNIRHRHLFTVSVITLIIITAFMRLYHLSDIAYGLHLDESYNGLDAYSLIGKPPWDWPVFFTSNFGREPLHIYLTTVVQLVLGPTKLALRVMPALASIALTPALIWLGWEIAPYLDIKHRKIFALWTGASVLTLLWAQMHARILVRGGLFLLLEVLILSSVWRAWTTQKLKWWLLAGFLAGLSLYTYLPARLLPLLFAVLLVALFFQQRERLNTQWGGIVAAVIVAIITAGPILIYFAGHPDDFLLRTGQVSIFSPEQSVNMVEQVGKVLGMAFIRGDSNLRMNYPYRPILDIFTTIPFLIGLVILFRHPLKIGSIFLFSLVAIMLSPTLLSVDPPNFGRAIGALPFFTILIAMGLDWGLRRVELWKPEKKTAFILLGSILLVISTLITWQIYFVKLQRIPGRFDLWDEGPTQLAYHVRNSDINRRVYIGPGEQGLNHPTVRYLLLTQPQGRVHGFDGRTCLRISTDTPAFYYFINNDFVRGPALLSSYLPDSEIEDVVFDHFGNVWAKRLIQSTTNQVVFPEMIPLQVELSDGIQLNGYWLSSSQIKPGEHLYVRLFWQAQDTPENNYTAFVHLIHMQGQDKSVVVGADSQPGLGSCRTDDWLAHEVIVDEKELIIPAELSSDDNYYLEIGFYTLNDGKRLMIPESQDNSIVIGPIPVSHQQ